MNNSIKKLITTFGVMFLMLGGIAFGQEYCKYDNECNPGEVCDAGICVEKENSTRNNNTTTAISAIDCKDGTKYIDGKGCVPCDTEGVCCGIELNTNVPFIGNCIELSKNTGNNTDEDETRVTEKTAFPRLMGGLTKMLVTIIMLVSFVAILAGGVMIASSGGSDSGAGNGKKLIGRVVIALALLGASGVILRLINPNFFG